MLTWDDEVKPSSQILLDGSRTNGRQVKSPPTAFEAPALQPITSAARRSPAPTTPQHRRVAAVDKRIINGQTDVTGRCPGIDSRLIMP